MVDQTAQSATTAAAETLTSTAAKIDAVRAEAVTGDPAIRRALGAILACSRAVRAAADEEALLAEFCRAAAERCGYQLAWIGAVVRDAPQGIRLLAHAGPAAASMSLPQIAWGIEATHRGPATLALQTGKITIFADVRGDERFAEAASQLEAMGIVALVALPIVVGGEVWGVLQLCAGPAIAIDADEVDLLTELAALVGDGLDRVGARHDLAAHKVAEDELRASERRLTFLLAHSPAAFFTSDATRGGALRFVSNSIAQVIGYQPDEFVDVMGFWIAHIHPDDLPRVLAEVSAGKSQGDQTQEFRFRHRDGHYIWLRSGLAVLEGQGGAPGEVVGYVIDITKRKQVEQALEENRDALRQANEALAAALRTKDEFLATVSHELRTPLAAILGLTESLQEQVYGPLTARQGEAVTALDESGRHLLAMINDILDVARSDLGQMALHLEPVDIDTVCNASLRLVHGAAHKKGLQIQLTCDPVGIVAMAEPRRLQQILVNLLSNAIKFTPAGGEVGLSVEGDVTGGTLRFCVWDTGIGIAPEQIGRLFRPFVQLDSGLARQYGGTGLGLVLVKRLAEAHGGRVEVTSTPGAGSRFVVTLPLQTSISTQAVDSARAEVATTVATRAPAVSTPRVLLAEDNEHTLHAYVDFLTQAGFQVEVARDGFAAVSMARALRPDIILMDIQMPGMDGYAAMRMLRADPDPAVAGVPILALTALAMPGDRERCLQAGANQYLVKPIGLPALAAHLRAEVKR